MSNKKTFFSIFLSGIAVYLCVFWINYFQSFYLSAWIHSLAFMALTWFWLSKTKGNIGKKNLVSAIILGRIILEVPIRILDFSGTVYSLMWPVSTIISILAALLCFYKRNVWIYILSAIIIVASNTILQTVWVSFLDRSLK